MRFLTVALACLAGAHSVVAWGAAGHEIVATIAQMHLHPSVLPTLCEILNFTSTNPNEPQCHLAPIATWADRNRWRMRWSGPLHYVGGLGDHPSDTCLFPGDRGWSGQEGINVLGGIRNTTTLLQEYQKDQLDIHTANEALKFLVHFLGDMHQPLHLTPRERGGNGIKVLFDGRQTKLHSLWDSLLLAKSLRTIPSNYSRPLPNAPQVEFNLRGAIYDPYIRRIVWEGLAAKWKDDISDWVACPAVSPTIESDPTMTLWQRVTTFFINRTIRNPGEGTDDDFLCPFYWASPIHEFNCDFIWPPALDKPPYSLTSFVNDNDDHHSHGKTLSPEDELSMVDTLGNFVGLETEVAAVGGPYLELDTPEYTGKIHDEWVLEKLFAQAGIRLAATLNWLFAVSEGDRQRLNVFQVQA